MTKTAEQDKQVKYCVVERNHLDAVNNRTGGIRDTTSDQPEQSIRRQAVNKRLKRKNDDPAHKHVHQRGQDIVSTGKKQLQNDPADCHSP